MATLTPRRQRRSKPEVTTASRVHRPSAFGASGHRFFELTITLARTDFKLRYFGSFLGYLWQLIRPLLFFGVIYVFFTEILHVGSGVPHYGVYLLTGIVLWTFFSEATGACVTALVARESLLRKMQFPRLVIPIAVTMTSVFNLAMNSIAVIVFALINGVYPSWSWLEMIPIAGGFLVLALGFGMLLSALYVRFRDIQPIWEVFSQILFYATPIMYPAYDYGHLGRYALLNPFAMLNTQMGHAFVHFYKRVSITKSNGKPYFGEPFPNAHALSGSWLTFIVSIVLIPSIFALGLWVFAREAPYVAENL